MGTQQYHGDGFGYSILEYCNNWKIFVGITTGAIHLVVHLVDNLTITYQ